MSLVFGRWDKPDAKVAAALDARLQEAKRKEDEAVQVHGACTSSVVVADYMTLRAI